MLKYKNKLVVGAFLASGVLSNCHGSVADGIPEIDEENSEIKKIFDVFNGCVSPSEEGVLFAKAKQSIEDGFDVTQLYPYWEEGRELNLLQVAGNPKTVKFALELPININFQDEKCGDTAAHGAAIRCMRDFGDAFRVAALNEGIEPEARQKVAEDAQDAYGMLYMMLQKKPDLSLQNSAGQTPRQVLEDFLTLLGKCEKLTAHQTMETYYDLLNNEGDERPMSQRIAEYEVPELASLSEVEQRAESAIKENIQTSLQSIVEGIQQVEQGGQTQEPGEWLLREYTNTEALQRLQDVINGE